MSAPTPGAVAADAPPAPAPKPPSPFETILQQPSLSSALSITEPLMKDTQDEADPAAGLLLAWMAAKGTWEEIAATPETSFALVMKDPEDARGKRLCATGSIVEIAKGKEAIKYFAGEFVTPGRNIVSFLAAKSTGAIVEHSTARFCGIVTGKHSYSNSGGGTTHSVRVVGMFDLPENKATPSKTALR